MKCSIIVGLLWGDEGKGLTTAFLSSPKEPTLNIRFNGGHQAGHTVVKGGFRRVFSSLGSGTMNEADTYISQYCTIDLENIYKELADMRSLGFSPKLYIHPLAMVVTPYDVLWNRQQERINGHGSVGVGFGATVERHTTSPCKLFAIDLENHDIFSHKMEQIYHYYMAKGLEERTRQNYSFSDIYFTERKIMSLNTIKDRYEHIVFEGAQGIMLDMDFGCFPHVTRSNTTSKNAMSIIKECGLPSPEIYYVMRSYATRHGNGPFVRTEMSGMFPDSTNILHSWQGAFRQGYHERNMIDHAFRCDDVFSNGCVKNLMITHLDQTSDKIFILRKGVRKGIREGIRVWQFIKDYTFKNILLCRNERGENIENYVPTVEEMEKML